MKNTELEFYFSAYPLKVTGTSAETNLRVSKPKTEDGILKILPVANSNKNFTVTVLPDTIKDMEKHDLGWYNNYE